MSKKTQEQENQQFGNNDDQENTDQLQDMPHEPTNESFYWLQDMPREPVNEPFYWNKKPGQKPLSTN